MIDVDSVMDTYGARIPDHDLRRLRMAADGGEDGVFTEELVASLAVNKIAVTPAERDELVRLVDETGEGRRFLPRLTVAASAS